jgi:hypothetical protein
VSNDHRPDDQTAADAFDAELPAREGPDALTSERALRLSQFRATQAAERQAALRDAERDCDRVGYMLAAFHERRGWSREQLADWLGIVPDELVRLAVEIRPAAVNGVTLLYKPEPINELADRRGDTGDVPLVRPSAGSRLASAVTPPSHSPGAGARTAGPSGTNWRTRADRTNCG